MALLIAPLGASRAELLVTVLLYASRPKVQVAAPLGADASEVP